MFAHVRKTFSQTQNFLQKHAKCKFTNVQMCKCTNVQMFAKNLFTKCANLQNFLSVQILQMCKCVVQMCKCANVQKPSCTKCANLQRKYFSKCRNRKFCAQICKCTIHFRTVQISVQIFVFVCEKFFVHV